MRLPEAAARCMAMLEEAGFAAYAVGGCVRDALLGLEPHDFDLCTGATPTQMKALFREYPLVLAGEKHGTVGVICDGEVVEITTFRTEGDYLDNRHPESVEFVTDIRQDLSRRDFTVNAMAWSPVWGLCDPFGGQKDLKDQVLRAVGDPVNRFQEDSLRILRGVRFAVRYGLMVEDDTRRAMTSQAHLMENLARERVFDELCKLLPGVSARDVLEFGDVLAAVIPELKPMMGFDQRSIHHRYDVFTHTAQVVGLVPPQLALRWAALLHDIGKPACFEPDEQGHGHFYGHAKVSAAMANDILLRLKSPTALRQQVVFLIGQHMTPLTPDRKILRRRLAQYGEENVRLLLALQKADTEGTGVAEGALDFDGIQPLLAEILAENACLSVKDLAVNGHDLMALGFRGREIGEMLDGLLAQVLEEVLPNQREDLLTAAKKEK